MTVFLIVALLLLAAALFFIMPTLLRKNKETSGSQRNEINLAVLRDQFRELDADLAAGIIDMAGYESAKTELEKRVAKDVLPDATIISDTPGKPIIAVLIGLIVPAVAISLYLFLGNPHGIEPDQVTAEQNQGNNVTPEQIANMVSGLEQRLKSNPGDADGWYMLARSYHSLSRYQDSAQAYAQLTKLIPDNAEVLADYADTLAMANNRSLLGEPEKMIARALVADPKNIKALALAGSAAFDRKEYRAAAAYWKKILPLVEANSEIAQSTTNNINEAQSMSGDTTSVAGSVPENDFANAKPEAEPEAIVSGAGAEVEGKVTLDLALQKKVDANDTVFIFARAAEGPRFPLAVLRKQVKDLPTNFRLDDTMSMMPNAKLSGYPLVVVGARISKSGSATPAPGDFEGLSKPVKPGAKGLNIVIDSERK